MVPCLTSSRVDPLLQACMHSTVPLLHHPRQKLQSDSDNKVYCGWNYYHKSNYVENYWLLCIHTALSEFYIFVILSIIYVYIYMSWLNKSFQNDNDKDENDDLENDDDDNGDDNEYEIRIMMMIMPKLTMTTMMITRRW